MSEKRLLEELGEDAFHYQADHIFMLVYDPVNIVKNPEALKRTFSKNSAEVGKDIKLFTIKPIVL